MEYQLLGNIFFIPENPFGKKGPNLNEVLTVKEDKIESKIAALTDATEDLKRLNLENKKNVPKTAALDTKSSDKDEVFLFIPDIKENSENKIKCYFENLFKAKDVKMLFLMVEKKIAIALHSVPFSSKILFF